MGRPTWQIRFITLFWPWRNQLARMCGWPILRRWLGRTFQGDEARYIPVRVEIPQAGSWILPDPWMERLLAHSSFRFLLHRCMCRSLEGCRNYPETIGCLFLGEGAREIDPSLGKEVSLEEAAAHYRRAKEAGLIPMVGRLRWDSIWLGVKSKNRLVAICFCCDCCCYFGMYRHLPREAAAGLQKIDGLSVQVTEACQGCGICVSRCFIGAMKLIEGKAVVGEDCRGCGRCATVCPHRAIAITLPSEDPLKEYLCRVAPSD